MCEPVHGPTLLEVLERSVEKLIIKLLLFHGAFALVRVTLGFGIVAATSN